MLTPVPATLLTVQVQQCLEKGVVFFNAGEALFLADFIPPDCFSGPPLPKEQPAVSKKEVPQKSAPPNPAGSFLIDLEEKLNPKTAGSKQNKKSKKHKRRREPPPWRR